MREEISHLYLYTAYFDAEVNCNDTDGILWAALDAMRIDAYYVA
jgi:hypothetical protein